MPYKIYKTPDPRNRLDASLRYEKGITDLLLSFDESIPAREAIYKIVTIPALNGAGFNVVACQTFFRKQGKATYLFLPETEELYSFAEAFFPIRDAARRFLKAGLKGLLLGAEEKGILERKIQGRDYDEVMSGICAQDAPLQDWYHFNGSAEQILEELQKKSRGLKS